MAHIYWIIPIFSALIGWLSLWIALRVLVYRIHPRYKHILAKTVAPWIVAHLASSEAISPDLSHVYQSDDVKEFLRIRMGGVLERFKEQMPVVGFFITDSVSQNISALAVSEIIKGLPDAQELMFSKVLQTGVLNRVIEEHLGAMNLATLWPVLSKVLRPAYAVAASTGFVLGLLEVALILFIH